jgi:5,5'-dehydrodivanillate O-demethylase
MDPVHLEFLHTAYFNYVLKRQGKRPVMRPRRHLQVAFDVFKFGIVKRRLLEGSAEDCDDWRIGHPILFPNILSIGTSEQARFEIRVPLDDTHTMIYHYFTKPGAADAPPQQRIPWHDLPYKHEDGRLVVETIIGQDMMVWLTQGEISDRTTERLVTSDRGVILLRALLREQLEKVERGEDPLAVIREPEPDEIIRIPREGNAFFYHTGGMIRETVSDPLAMVRTINPTQV